MSPAAPATPTTTPSPAPWPRSEILPQRGRWRARRAGGGPPPTPRFRSTPTAFTLIELLVSISIIAILISLTIPAIGSARESSRRVKCLANLRSIGQALQSYLNDSKDTLPYVRPLHDPDGNSNDPSLLDLLAVYLTVDPPRRVVANDPNSPYERVADTLICPSDRVGRDAATNYEPVWRFSGTSYEYFAGEIMVGGFMLRVSNPARAVTQTYQAPRWRELPVVVDYDDWHNLRARGVKRNALFYGDWRTDWCGPIIKLDVNDKAIQELICDVASRYGGVPIPGCR